MQKKCKIICIYQKKVVPLSPNLKIKTRRQRKTAAKIEVKTYTQIFKRQRKGGSYIYKTAEGEVLINQGTKDYEYFAPSHWGGWVLGTLDECLLNIYEVRDTALKYLRNVTVNPEYYGDDWEREYQIAKDYVEWTKQIDVIPVTTIQ